MCGEKSWLIHCKTCWQWKTLGLQWCKHFWRMIVTILLENMFFFDMFWGILESPASQGFNQQLQGVNLPTELQSLTFGSCFDQSVWSENSLRVWAGTWDLFGYYCGCMHLLLLDCGVGMILLLIYWMACHNACMFSFLLPRNYQCLSLCNMHIQMHQVDQLSATSDRWRFRSCEWLWVLAPSCPKYIHMIHIHVSFVGPFA